MYSSTTGMSDNDDETTTSELVAIEKEYVGDGDGDGDDGVEKMGRWGKPVRRWGKPVRRWGKPVRQKCCGTWRDTGHQHQVMVWGRWRRGWRWWRVV